MLMLLRLLGALNIVVILFAVGVMASFFLYKLPPDAVRSRSKVAVVLVLIVIVNCLLIDYFMPKV